MTVCTLIQLLVDCKTVSALIQLLVDYNDSECTDTTAITLSVLM